MYRTLVFDIAKERGVSDAALARKTGLSQAYISRVRAGSRQIGSGFIRAAMRAFPDLTYEQLFIDGVSDEKAISRPSVQIGNQNA